MPRNCARPRKRARVTRLLPAPYRRRQWCSVDSLNDQNTLIGVLECGGDARPGRPQVWPRVRSPLLELRLHNTCIVFAEATCDAAGPESRKSARAASKLYTMLGTALASVGVESLTCIKTRHHRCLCRRLALRFIRTGSSDCARRRF